MKVHRKSSEDHTLAKMPIFTFNRPGAAPPGIQPNHLNMLLHSKSLKTTLVSPVGGGAGEYSRFDSPKSSNVSSFYMDRIEDMLPEKILITKKKFIRNF